ncbi:hypothetical protein N2152v2_004030 [Parachlorella kessleri]
MSAGKAVAPAHPRSLGRRRRQLGVTKVQQSFSQDVSSGGAAAGAGPLSTVTFTVQRHVAFGQALKVVGSSPVLGSWDCTAAPGMEWSDGDNWALTVELPAGRHEFKIVVSGGTAYDWESGGNRIVEVPDSLAAANSKNAFSVVCEWGQPGSMLATFPEGPLRSVEALKSADNIGTDSDAGEAWVEDMAGEPMGAVNDDDEPRATSEDLTIGKMMVEASTAAGSESATAAAAAAAAAGDDRAEPENGTEAAQALGQDLDAATLPGTTSAEGPPFEDSDGARAVPPYAAASGEAAPQSWTSAAASKAAEAPTAEVETTAEDATRAAEAAEEAGAPEAEAAPAAAPPVELTDAETVPTRGEVQPAYEPAAEAGSAAATEEGKESSLGGPAEDLEEQGAPALSVGKMEVEAASPAKASDPDSPAASGGALTRNGSPSATTAADLAPSKEESSLTEEQQQGAPPAASDQPASPEVDSQAGRPNGNVPVSQPGPSSAAAAGDPQAEEKQEPEVRGQADLQPQVPEGSPAGSAGLQLAAATLGLLALPVVAWSEYQLAVTGCGLPPGPDGLLGAAEGVAYLVVGGVALTSLVKKITTGRGLPAGPAGLLGAAEGGSWLAVVAGLAVLVLQVQTRGYIPSALPDSQCFGPGAPTQLERRLKVPSVKLPELPDLPKLPTNLPDLPKLPTNLPNLPELPKLPDLPELPAVPKLLEDLKATLKEKVPSLQFQSTDPGLEGSAQLAGSELGSVSTPEAAPAPASPAVVPSPPQQPEQKPQSSGIGSTKSTRVQGDQLDAFRRSVAKGPLGTSSLAGLVVAPPLADTTSSSSSVGGGTSSSTAGDVGGSLIPGGSRELLAGGLTPGGSKELLAQQQQARMQTIAASFGKAVEGLASLVDPSATAAEAPPPPLKPKLEAALDAVKKTDVQPLVSTLQRVFGDLKEGFVGIGQTLLPGEGPGLGAGPVQPAAAPVGDVAASGGPAGGSEQGGSKGRPGDTLREVLHKADLGDKVMQPVREMGKRTSALVERTGRAAQALVSPLQVAAPQAQQQEVQPRD